MNFMLFLSFLPVIPINKNKDRKSIIQSVAPEFGRFVDCWICHYKCLFTKYKKLKTCTKYTHHFLNLDTCCLILIRTAREI